MTHAINFIKRLICYRSVIRLMALRSIQSRYAGTLGGILWSVINPLMLVLVYWFVFSVGFKVKPASGLPFIVVFLCGLMPWLMFNEVLLSNVNAITSNAHLVKKTIFPTEFLPFINLIASFITHTIMLVILFVVFAWNGVPLHPKALGIFYYFAALAVLSLGLSWLFSSLNVFYRDVSQALAIMLNLWFWLTPIVWDTHMLSQKYHWMMKLNPMYYIIQGYKSCLLGEPAVWSNAPLTAYFWVITLAAFVIGALIFKRLKPEFPDVV